MTGTPTEPLSVQLLVAPWDLDVVLGALDRAGLQLLDVPTLNQPAPIYLVAPKPHEETGPEEPGGHRCGSRRIEAETLPQPQPEGCGGALAGEEDLAAFDQANRVFVKRGVLLCPACIEALPAEDK